MKNILFSIFFCLGLSACGGGANPDKAALNVAKSISGTSYTDLGSGKMLMSEALSDVSEGFNFEFSFNLADGGSMTFTSFASPQLSNGFEIKFSRAGAKLNVQAVAQGQTQDWSSMFTSIDASQNVTLTMDVHNDESPAHVMIWQGEKAQDKDHTNTLYNSAEDSVDLNYDSSPGNGFGRAWGFALDNAHLLKVKLSSPQDGH